MKGSFQNFRDGLIIEISNEERFIGFGDAAPFPGLHRESLKNIIHEIKNRILQLSAFEYDLKQNIFSILKQLPPFSPSLQFAIEWAFVDLIAKTNKVNPAILFNPNPEKNVKIATRKAVSEIIIISISK